MALSACSLGCAWSPVAPLPSAAHPTPVLWHRAPGVLLSRRGSVLSRWPRGPAGKAPRRTPYSCRGKTRSRVSDGGRTLWAQSAPHLFRSGPDSSFGLSSSEIVLYSRSSKTGCGRMMRRTPWGRGTRGGLAKCCPVPVPTGPQRLWWAWTMYTSVSPWSDAQADLHSWRRPWRSLVAQKHLNEQGASQSVARRD